MSTYYLFMYNSSIKKLANWHMSSFTDFATDWSTIPLAEPLSISKKEHWKRFAQNQTL